MKTCNAAFLPLCLLSLSMLSACEQASDPNEVASVRLVPRLLLNNDPTDTVLPVVDSIEAILQAEGKTFHSGAAWSAHALELPNVPVGQEYHLTVKGWRHNADHSGWILTWGSGDVVGKIEPLGEVDFRKVVVSLTVGDTTPPVLTRFNFLNDTTVYSQDSVIALQVGAVDTGAGASTVIVSVNGVSVPLSGNQGTAIVALPSGTTVSITIRAVDANNNVTFQVIRVRRPSSDEVVAAWDRCNFDQVLWQ